MKLEATGQEASCCWEFIAVGMMMVGWDVFSFPKCVFSFVWMMDDG